MTSVLLDHEQLRAAIALNSIGVSLLEKKCFSQAHDTLREAAIAMRQASLKRDSQVGEKTESYLVEASKRLLNPQPSHNATITNASVC